MSLSLQAQENDIRAAKQEKKLFFKFSPLLEEEFHQFRHERLLKRVPIIGVSGLCLFTLFAILDVFILPEAAYTITTCIRLFLICPLIMLAMLAAKQRWPIKLFSWYYLGAYIIAGLGIVAIIFTARLNNIILPYDGVLLHLVFGYFLMGMPYKLATLGGVAVTTGYISIELMLNTPQEQLAYNTLFICTLNVMGCMGSYMQDRSRRHLFLNKKLVELAMAKDVLEIESKTKLVATASHDLRQPLHAMNILVEALQNETKGEETNNLTLKLKESLRQLSQLLTSLLDISRFNAKIVEHNPINIDLASTIKTMLHNQRIRASELGIEISEEGPSPCLVRTDPVLLERVFRNLCENVYQHAQATQLTISWGVHKESIRLNITDNGRGINQDDQDRIFEEFHKSKDGSKSGMGLGLSIVKQSCDIMNSKLGVNSNVGDGATFWVDLMPAHTLEQTISISQKANKTDEVDAFSNKYGSNKNDSTKVSTINASAAETTVRQADVLVVSENHDLLDLYTNLLKKWGYTSTTKASALGAINALEHGQYRLIIADMCYQTSDKTGVDLIKLANKRQENAPSAILISDSEEEELSSETAQALLDHSDQTEVLIKPVSPAKLKLVVQHSLKNKPRK